MPYLTHKQIKMMLDTAHIEGQEEALSDGRVTYSPTDTSWRYDDDQDEWVNQWLMDHYRDARDHEADKYQAAQWARDVLAGPFVVVDTETTGIPGQHDDVRIVQIAVIDEAGRVLLDEIVDPGKPIPPAATAIHGITDEDAFFFPTFPQIHDRLVQALDGVPFVAFNVDFDYEVIRLECERHRLPLPSPAMYTRYPDYGGENRLHITHDVMVNYAAFWGSWHDYHESYTWQSLANAVEQQRLLVSEGGHHDALADARHTLALLNKMASY